VEARVIQAIDARTSSPVTADELSPLERRVAVAVSPSFGFDMTRPEFRSILRDHMRETAYHEAGHVAARAFTGLELSHVISVSIIPEPDSSGRVSARAPVTEMLLGCYPPTLAWHQGHMLLLEILAGRGVQARMDGVDPSWIVDGTDEEDEEEGQDIWRANRIARIMARRSWHMWRVLDRAARWTSEMLHVPAVWACVETIAGLLLERGTIEDRDGLLRIMLEVPHAVSLPKWRHRLFPSAKEVRELWHPGPAPAPAGETPTGARAASAATEEAP